MVFKDGKIMLEGPKAGNIIGITYAKSVSLEQRNGSDSVMKWAAVFYHSV